MFGWAAASIMKKFLEFTFPDEIRGWLVEEIHIFFRIFPHGGFVV